MFALESWRRALDGDPLAFTGVRPTPEVMARMRAVQLSTVAKNTPVMMLATCINVFLFVAVMWRGPNATAAIFWAVAILVLSSFLCAKRMRPREPAPAGVSARGIHLATIYAVAHGGLWGDLPALFFAHATASEQLLISCLCIGSMCGGAFALSPIPVATLAYVGPIIGGAAVAIVISGDPIYNAVAGLTVVYTAVLLFAANARARALAMSCAEEARREEGALKDELTRLPNRAFFRDALARLLDSHHRTGDAFALMCFDLDGFKAVNDTMGHAAGDQVLIEAAARLRSVTRKHDTVARLGGDEFALIAPGVRSPALAKSVAERIVAAFREPFEIDGQFRAITISIGIALAPVDGDTIESLLRNADSALYATKHSGRSGYTFFRERFAFVSERATLESELDRALMNDELFLVFQPFVHAATLQTTGFEALLRWNHPTRGVLSAELIIPLLERGGLIGAVGAWAIEEAIKTAKAWPSHLLLSVNVSSLQLRKPGFDKSLKAMIAAHEFDPKRLELELTESALLLDGEQAVATLQALRAVGVRTTLDDLGAGYSSLANLVELPLDRLKIDRSFIAEMLVNPMRQSVVKVAIQLARTMGLDITAEGVETLEQLEFLRAYGGSLEVQGYLICRPRPAQELASIFASCPLIPANDDVALAV